MASTLRYLTLLGALVLAGCPSNPSSVECATGIICPDGTQCAAVQPVCIINNCGNGLPDPGEKCDDGNIVDGDGCSKDCSSTEDCGDGVVNTAAGELCDDGNTMDGDGCAHDCRSVEQCGNHIVDFGEVCDDGNTTPGDGCSANCKSTEVCGNGVRDVDGLALPETCDDGNTVSGDACNSDCRSGPGCGNGVLDAGEECDDGNNNTNDDCVACHPAICGDGIQNTAGTRLEQCDAGVGGVPKESAACNIDCTLPLCGDAKVNQAFGEQCDDGTAADSTFCDSDCTAPVCGDNHRNTVTEQCDPGTVGADITTCDSDCTVPACGDSHVNTTFTPVGATVPEGCDDGGTTPGDGCSALCQIESCGNGTVEAVNGEQCDDGNTNDLDGCRNNCQLPGCGDGVASASEICDTGGDTATCDHDCTLPQCNDGIMNPAANEQCEDGNLTNGDGCSSTCRLEPFTLSLLLTGTGTGTVTSNPIGITCGLDCSELYLSGTLVTLTATPGPTSTFAGWSGGGCSGTGTCVTTMDAAKTVTATFAANRLTVTRSGTGTGTVTATGINCGNTCTADFTIGTMVTLTPTPSANSLFTGWSGACTGTGPCVVTMNAATSVDASFTLDTYVLSVGTSGTGAGSVSSVPTGISCGSTCSASFSAGTMVTLFPTAAAGSSFTSWSGACTGSGSCVVTMDAAKSVTATFSPLPVTLTVSVTSGGSVSSSPAGISCGSTCSALFAFGTVVTLTPTPSAKNAFTGWGGACSGTGACMVTMDAAKTVTATFAVNRLTVVRSGNGTGTVTSSPSGISCGGNCTQDFNANTSVTLTAAAASGSRFAGWSEPSCSGSTCVVVMNGPLTVTATFVDQNTLTVTTSGNGSGTVASTPAGVSCPGTCVAPFDSGTAVTLTPTPAAGSVFTGWSGACTGTGACVVTLSANSSVSASFALLRTLTVTVSATGGAAGSVSSAPAGISCGATCTADFVDGTAVTLTETPTTGVFAGWTGDCASCAFNTTCMITMSAAKSCTASFTP